MPALSTDPRGWQAGGINGIKGFAGIITLSASELPLILEYGILIRESKPTSNNQRPMTKTNTPKGYHLGVIVFAEIAPFLSGI